MKHEKLALQRSNSIIEAINVRKEYNTGRVKVQALKGVDLRIQRGEVVAIMGPSGCGKTTLLNCLSGLDSITSGTVKIAGQNLHWPSDRQRTTVHSRGNGLGFQTVKLL